MKNKEAPTALAADKARALALTPVSRETEQRLDIFVDLLAHWQNSINLVSPATLPQLWTRHIADSLQLLRLVDNPTCWVDLGAGGGFPGLVLACALADVPGAEVHLVESNQKKAAFLREAARVTGAPARVHAARIADFLRGFSGRPDAVSARALAPLKVLLDEAAPLLKTGAKGVFPKGQDVDAELTEASKYWKFNHDLVPSVTSPDGRIIVVRSLVVAP
jgi:16S rRNA (guanine527-N7)-methyltransferase